MLKKNILKSILYNLISFGLIILIIEGCQIVKQPTSNNPDQYFSISIYSIGTGIDQAAKNVVVNTIHSYLKKGYDITYSAVSWGREGEVDYCFELQKLKPTVYQEFFNELSSLLKDKQVHIKEKAPCRSNY